MNKIVFLITKDAKFTQGIIDYFDDFYPNYDKSYYIVDRKNVLSLSRNDNVHVFTSYTEFAFDKGFIHSIHDCDKIIVSGFFTMQFVMTLYSKYLSKTYIQFWGGDIYRFRKNSLRNIIEKIFVNHCVKKCAAVITLTYTEIEEFKQLFPYSIRFLSAPVLEGKESRILSLNQRKLAIANQNDDIKSVIVGNSATKENRHEELFDILSKTDLKNVRIICPLSYGDQQYADKVENLGKALWGDNFFALRSFMKYEDYVNILFNCQVGIYYHNRQQGMGNVSIMTNLGKKVYISRNSSLWDYYENYGYLINATEDLPKQDQDSIFSWSIDKQEENFKAIERRKDAMDEAWRKILDDDPQLKQN